jgi:RNA polymerase sigma-32 factor
LVRRDPEKKHMRTSTRRLTAASWDRDLDRYLHEIYRFPLPDAGEELSLARRRRHHRDSAAAHRSVTGHLRLVVKLRPASRQLDLGCGGHVALAVVK